MKSKTLRFILVLLLMLTLSGCLFKRDEPAIESPLKSVTEGITFYAPLDEDVAPVMTSGSNEVIASDSYTFESALLGKGMELLTGKSGVTYSQPQNLNPEEGTISFWFKPGWSTGEALASNPYLFDWKDAFLVYDAKNTRISFVHQKEDKSFDWFNYSVNWGQGDWVMFVVTWKEAFDNKALYINASEDGRLAGPGPRGARSMDNIPDEFVIANNAAGDRTAIGLFDDLLIWDRQLSENEILSLYQWYQSKPTKHFLETEELDIER